MKNLSRSSVIFILVLVALSMSACKGPGGGSSSGGNPGDGDQGIPNPGPNCRVRLSGETPAEIAKTAYRAGRDCALTEDQFIHYLEKVPGTFFSPSRVTP